MADERFDAFWMAYPKKVGKQDAMRQWRKLRPDAAMAQRIMAAVMAQRVSAQWLKDAGQFIPNPSTWLYQGRWDDEVETPQRPVLRGLPTPPSDDVTAQIMAAAIERERAKA
jgi:hypothetical protein